MDGFLQGAIDFFIGFFTTDTDNVMSSSINKLMATQSANLDKAWLRNALGIIIALLVLCWVLSVIINGIRAALSNDVGPFVMTLFQAPKQLFMAAFVIPIVTMLIYIGDWLSWVAVTAPSKIGSGSSDGWKSAFTLKDIEIRIQSALIGSTFGNLLEFHASIVAYSTYFFVIMATLALCAYMFGGETSFFYVFAKAGLIAAIFMKSAMLFVMTTGGTLATSVAGTAQDRAAWAIFIIVLTSMCPTILFIGSLINGLRKRKLVVQAREEFRQQFTASSTSTTPSTSGGTRLRKLAFNEGTATGAAAAGVAIGAKIAARSHPAAGAAGAAVKVSSTAVANFLRRKG